MRDDRVAPVLLGTFNRSPGKVRPIPSRSTDFKHCSLATYGDASNIETPAASASQPIWHFQRSSVPKQLRQEIRSQYSWQVSQSNWPPTDWAAGLSAAGIVKTVLRKGESCRVE